MRYDNSAYRNLIWSSSFTCCELCEGYVCCGKVDKQVVGNANVISADGHRAARVDLCANDIYAVQLDQ
jgi:hypothetical protein